ncbi:Na(+)/H(+) antiporter subunit B [Nannocystis bainbridge]|uniref:Na(+)/H(+) antiporter subunit B n=1 Tax=Nannocystis bainbridge TaxID=2995303 RepID=A0ABT5DRX8_9BACT|nr:Na(+)/H(+) antiporter subunit B [Nannocystis bainbridge]MDC0715473.1 Na(+)/H(+) antiporter subunit B [Nannocystis bainbridge]
MNAVVLIDTLLLLLVTATAVAIIEVRSLYASAILTGIYSLLMALVWVNMHSMDVSFTEAAVGGGISTILLIGTLVHVGREEKPIKKRLHVPALIFTALTGAALIYGTLDMPRFGDPAAPIHHYRVPEMMAQTVGFVNGTPGKQKPPEGFDLDRYRRFDGRVTGPIPDDPKDTAWREKSILQTEGLMVPQVRAAHEPHAEEGHHLHPPDDFNGHVPNSVTSLLAAYRGYDTMFETTVIFTAGISLILLLRRPRREGYLQPGAALSDQVILRVVTKLSIPFILIFGFYVITHGELGPGGGFQGGVVLATAFILYALIFGRAALYRVVPPPVSDILTGVGVLIYSGTGAACMLLGGKFLDYSMLNPAVPGDGESLGMTLVEYGVGLTVSMVMLTIFNQLAEERST